jgi:hypothetical protein
MSQILFWMTCLKKSKEPNSIFTPFQSTIKSSSLIMKSSCTIQKRFRNHEILYRVCPLINFMVFVFTRYSKKRKKKKKRVKLIKLASGQSTLQPSQWHTTNQKGVHGLFLVHFGMVGGVKVFVLKNILK